jgi:ABC-2 type transport system ATP-binding protein
VTVILTAHDLGDVEKLCERVMMIDHGKLLFDGAPGELVRRFGGERELVVDLAEDYASVEIDGARVATGTIDACSIASRADRSARRS